jgi:hypothetical protein
LGEAGVNGVKLTTTASAPAQRLTERPAWKALAEHCLTVCGPHLRQLFADDPQRGDRLTAEAVDVYLDAWCASGTENIYKNHAERVEGGAQPPSVLREVHGIVGKAVRAG